MADTRWVEDRDADERRPTLVDAAYRALKHAICHGEFPPGFRGSEQEMAQRLGMSRTPVHQAIVRLQSEGMVDLQPKRGVVITALSPFDMKEVYDVIIGVEAMAALLLAGLPDGFRNEACDELQAINDAIADALSADDLLRWADLDARFHERLVAGSGNSRLIHIARVNTDQSYRARRLTLRMRPRPSSSIGEHQDIVDAIRDGDGERARKNAHDHKIRARDMIVDVLRRYDMKHL